MSLSMRALQYVILLCHPFYATAGSKTKSSSSSKLPIAVGSNRQGKQKNEIYVDILEKLTVLFNSNGFVVNSSIDGTIQMKSFLSGNPELRLALNEDLVIGEDAVLLCCSAAECVNGYARSLNSLLALAAVMFSPFDTL